MPRHASAVQNAQSVADEVVYVLEVHDPRVVVILTGEKCLREVRRVHIGERVRMRVPSSEAEIKSTDASIVVVDNDDFLVVRPEFDGI